MRGNTLVLKKIPEMAGKGEFLGCDIFKLCAFETKMKIMKKITCMFLERNQRITANNINFRGPSQTHIVNILFLFY